MGRKLPGGGLWLLAVAFPLVGCGSKTGLLVDEAGLDAAPPDTARDTGPECVPFRAVARLASLDIFLMMDSSGSMEDPTAGGVSKAEAVTDALRGFVRAPESEGIGVALSFFPVENLEVPEQCASDSQCGAPDACLQFDICMPSGIEACRTAADCSTVGDTCEPLGRCSMDPTDLCVPSAGLTCLPGVPCTDYGLCENRTSCVLADYRRPTVPLGLLPGAGSAILQAMRTRVLNGGTPTLPALRGAIGQATAWSRDNPGSQVIVLLATDGFPTSCDPSIDFWVEDPRAGIANLAAEAATGATAGIRTFVIGVFAPEDELDARINLATIARAGGTGEALVVTTAEPVAERLLEILNEVRRSVRTCVYAIPHAGVLPDPSDLRVRLVRSSEVAIDVPRRAGPAACDPATGGFYLEQDLGAGVRPGFVELCPASCVIAASPDFSIEMEAGC